MTSVSDSLLAAVNGTSSTSSASAAASSASSLTDSSGSAIQDRFLTLLVAQLQNQDPSNPMDNSQLTSQMAQLSTVTGIDKLNTTLATLMSNLQSTQSVQATSMIGHSVLAPGSTVALNTETDTAADGTTTTSEKGVMGVQLATNADSVIVTIRDASGKAIHSVDLGAQTSGTLPIVWDGTTSSGTKAAPGNYTFEVAATSGGTPVAATALAFGAVNSVSTSATDGVTLNVSTLGQIKVSDVVEIL